MERRLDMQMLLDTHILLWSLSLDKRLPERIKNQIANGANEIFISPVSIWEMEIKKKRKKLTYPKDIYTHIEKVNFKELSITTAHAEEAGRLPEIHPDPFDRMLIAQARIENIPLATIDKTIAKYDVALVS